MVDICQQKWEDQICAVTNMWFIIDLHLVIVLGTCKESR